VKIIRILVHILCPRFPGPPHAAVNSDACSIQISSQNIRLRC